MANMDFIFDTDQAQIYKVIQYVVQLYIMYNAALCRSKFD